MQRTFFVAVLVVGLAWFSNGCRKEDRDRICVRPEERTPESGLIALERVRLDEEGYKRLAEWLEGVQMEEVVRVYDDLARACGDCPEALVHGALAVLRRDPKTGKELAKLVLQEIGDYRSSSADELRRESGTEPEVEEATGDVPNR